MWCFDAGITDVVLVNDHPDASDGEMINGRHVSVISDWRTPHLFIVGIRNPNAKGMMVAKALLADWQPHASIIHPNATVRSEIEPGGVICPGAVVAGDVRIGRCVIIGSNSTVDNNTWIGGNTTLDAGVHVGQSCRIAGFAHICTGAVLGDQAKIDHATRIEAGSRIINTHKGNP